MDTCNYLYEKRNLQPSFEDEISKLDQIIISSTKSVKGRNTKSSSCATSDRLNKKYSNPKEFRGHDGGLGNKANLLSSRGSDTEKQKKELTKGHGCQQSSEFVRCEAEHSRVLKTQSNESKPNIRKQDLEVGVRSSVSSGARRPLHKAKSSSERRPDRGAEIHKKLKRLFSPEPEKEGDSVRLEKSKDRSSISFAPESDGKSKTREPDHDYKEKGRVFQQNTGKIHPSTESGNGSQKTSKVSDEKSNTKKSGRDAEIHKKLKILFSPEPDTDHESNIVNGRQLQETRNRHLEKDSGGLQTTGVRSSVSSGVERPPHKAKSTSERRADRDAEIHKKLKRLFSPEPEKEGASVRLEKKEDRSSMSFAPESDGKSKTREPDHDKEKGRVFQQNTGKIHPSTESGNGSQKTSKVSDEKSNTKKSGRDAEIHKKLKILFSPEPDTDHESNIVNGRQLQETRNRHLEKDSGGLQTTGVRSSVSSGVERPPHKAKSTSERRADRDAEIHKKLKRLFSPEPEKEGASVRLEKKEDRSSMSFAPESDGKSKTREPDHDKEKGRVFQQNTGKSRPSTESRNGSQKTNKVSDGKSNTKKKDRDAEIHKKLKRLFSPEPDTDHESNIVNGRQLLDTRDRHQKEDGGRLANIEDRPSISFAPGKRELNLGEETRKSSCCKKAKVSEKSKTKVPNYDPGLKEKSKAKEPEKIETPSRLKKITDEPSTSTAPAKRLEGAKSNFEDELSKMDLFVVTSSKTMKMGHQKSGCRDVRNGVEPNSKRELREHVADSSHNVNKDKIIEMRDCQHSDKIDIPIKEQYVGDCLPVIPATLPSFHHRNHGGSKRETDIRKVQELRKRTEVGHLEKGSGRIQDVGVKSSISFAPRGPPHKDESDHGARLKRKLSRLFSPEPEKHHKADMENRNREKESHRLQRIEGGPSNVECQKSICFDKPRVMRGYRKKIRFCRIGDTWMRDSVRQKRPLIEEESDREPPRKVPRLDVPAKKGL